jgi:hypothetical protein
MYIGEPLRTIVVEPLERPVKDLNTEHESERAPLAPEPEQIPGRDDHSLVAPAYSLSCLQFNHGHCALNAVPRKRS